MTQAWYHVASLSFGYASAAMILLIILLALRTLLADRSLWRRVRRDLSQADVAGVLRVNTARGKRGAADREIPVPYEGTLGSARSCDVRIPYRKVHLRSAFFWMEHDALHMVPLHRDGFEVDGDTVEPGDEAVLRDGATLRVGELSLVLHLHRFALADDALEPYVTPARRYRAREGHAEGIGAPGKREAKREKRRMAKQAEKSGKAPKRR